MAQYEILDEIGAGGQARVFRARRGDGVVLAMKRLDASSTSEQQARFAREVRMQSSLSHPNIMPILGFHLEETNRPFFVMPLAVGNLQDHLAPLSYDLTVAYGYYEEILAAIEHAHQNGVVHRDLKPQNILFLEELGATYPVVGDFGSGRLLERDSTTLTGSGWLIGTLGYAAPEQLGDAKHADERSDIYALGVILHEMLTRVLPGPSSDMSRLPSGLGYIVEKCIRSEPDKRYQSVAELRRDFTLFTTRTELLEEPAQAAKQLIESLAGENNLELANLQPLNAIFQDNLTDELLLTGTFANLPEKVLTAYTRLLPAPFRAVLRAYDQAVSGWLAFEYCDVVARFYRQLYGMFHDVGTRAMLLSRLVEMGVGHNRFNVMAAVGEILSGIRDASEAAMARDVLESHPDDCRVLMSYLDDVRLPLLRQTIDKLSAQRA